MRCHLDRTVRVCYTASNIVRRGFDTKERRGTEKVQTTKHRARHWHDGVRSEMVAPRQSIATYHRDGEGRKG
jgi:hypothetical protein